MSIQSQKMLLKKHFLTHIEIEKIRKENLERYGSKELMQEQDLNGMSYSKMMNLLNKSNIEINRKVLADLAMNHPETFSDIVSEIEKNS